MKEKSHLHKMDKIKWHRLLIMTSPLVRSHPAQEIISVAPETTVVLTEIEGQVAIVDPMMEATVAQTMSLVIKVVTEVDQTMVQTGRIKEKIKTKKIMAIKHNKMAIIIRIIKLKIIKIKTEIHHRTLIILMDNRLTVITTIMDLRELMMIPTEEETTRKEKMELATSVTRTIKMRRKKRKKKKKLKKLIPLKKSKNKMKRKMMMSARTALFLVIFHLRKNRHLEMRLELTIPSTTSLKITFYF